MFWKISLGVLIVANSVEVFYNFGRVRQVSFSFVFSESCEMILGSCKFSTELHVSEREPGFRLTRGSP